MQENFLSKLENLAKTGILYEIADKVYSATDIVKYLGYSANGKRISDVNFIVGKHDIDTSHWTPNGKPKVQSVSKICPVCGEAFSFFEREPRTTCSYSCANTLFRSGKDNPNWKDNSDYSYRIKALKHYGCKCTKCGYSENKVALAVHHKDRNRFNNSLENLEVLCANCHAIEHYSKLNKKFT